jgi:hypothetical protein
MDVQFLFRKVSDKNQLIKKIVLHLGDFYFK